MDLVGFFSMFAGVVRPCSMWDWTSDAIFHGRPHATAAERIGDTHYRKLRRAFWKAVFLAVGSDRAVWPSQRSAHWVATQWPSEFVRTARRSGRWVANYG
jgi:hypothetical protein